MYMKKAKKKNKQKHEIIPLHHNLKVKKNKKKTTRFILEITCTYHLNEKENNK